MGEETLPIAFKILIPANYPSLEPPIVFLDELVDESMIDSCWYLRKHNRIEWEYVTLWAERAECFKTQTDNGWPDKLNLKGIYKEIYLLFSQYPPVKGMKHM